MGDGPGGVKVRWGALHYGCQVQVQTSTPLSMVKGQVLEGVIELPSFPLSPVASLQSPGLSMPSLILPLRLMCCTFSSSASPLGFNKLPSSLIRGCSNPKGVVSPVGKPNQELESDSFLKSPQNNPSGVSSLVSVCLWS